jgi:hypothetical protein
MNFLFDVCNVFLSKGSWDIETGIICKIFFGMTSLKINEAYTFLYAHPSLYYR